MAEAHRLRHLQVREARQDRPGVGIGDLDQRAPQRLEQRDDGVDLVAQPQADVGRDLVVARAARVQALAGVADELRQPGLDVQVHVLEFELPGTNSPRSISLAIAPCPVGDGAPVLGAEDALAASISACARLPAMSAFHRRRSNDARR